MTDNNADPGPNPGPTSDPTERRQTAALAEEETNKRESVGSDAPTDLPSGVRDLSTDSTGNAAAADRLSAGDEPPEGAIAEADDFLIQRDPKTGDVMPIWQRIPGTQKYARVIPMSNAEAEARLPASGNMLEMEDDALLDMLQEKFVTPDIGAAGSLDDLQAFGIEPLVMCLNYASGFEMTRGIVSENSDLAQLATAVEGNSRTGN